MTTTNDITGDSLVSKAGNDKFRANYDNIFGKKEVKGCPFYSGDECHKACKEDTNSVGGICIDKSSCEVFESLEEGL